MTAPDRMCGNVWKVFVNTGITNETIHTIWFNSCVILLAIAAIHSANESCINQ